nr:hypothetical protein [Tanacetum cinerariifolium]
LWILLLINIKSKESTLQLVYDVLRICPFFKAFLVTADVPEIYMQEFWATATVHHHTIRFKMDNKKHIVNLESFRDMLHIYPRVHGQTFDEPAFEEEILAFIRFLRHIVPIRTLTDVNINKLYQPWRSFAAIINKCLTGKSSGYDSLRLSQAQILWGLYHKINVDYVYMMWEDFVYQVEHKNQKKSNEMHYPWDDFMFSTIKLVSKHQNTQQFGALLPIEMTNDEIRNSNAYKEYYVVVTGEAAPKPKANVRRTRSGSDTSITPPITAASPRLTASAKGKQTAKASKAKSQSALSEVAMTEAQQLKLVTKRSRQQMHISQASGFGADEGTGSISWVLDVPTDESEEELSWNSSDDESADEEGKDDDDDEEDEGDDGEEGNDDEDDDGEEGDDDDDDDQEVVKNDDKDNAEESRDDDEEGEGDEQEYGEEDDDEETRDKESFDPIPQNPESSENDGNDVEDIGLILGKEEEHVEEEEEDKLYRDRMNEVVKVAVQIQSDQLRDEAQRENDEFLRTVDENIKKIIKKQVKEQVKVQVSKILPRIKQAMNEQLQTKVLTRSYHSSRTSYTVAVDLSEMELKKILIEKMEGNKSIQREGKEPKSASTPSKTAIRSADRSTTGSRSRQASASEFALAEEPVQTTSQMEEPLHPEFDTGADDQPIILSFQHPEWFSQPQKPPTPDRDWNRTLLAVHESIQPWISELAKQANTRSSFNELMDTPLDLSNFIMNRLRIELEYHLEEVYKAITGQLDWVNPKGQQYPHKLLQPLPLIPDNRGRRVIPFAHFINNDLEYLFGGASSRKYTTSVSKTKAAYYGHIKWIEDLVPRTMWIHEPIDYDKHALWGRRIIAVTKLKIVKYHSYKHLDWITVRRDDDKLYKFKEGNFKRLRIQDIEDMLLLLVQGNLTNLTVEEHFAFNVSLRMFTRSIVIQRRVEDLQLGVESYQKRLNLTKSDTY